MYKILYRIFYFVFGCPAINRSDKTNSRYKYFEINLDNYQTELHNSKEHLFYSFSYTTSIYIVNGLWGKWSAYSRCSRTCGAGTRVRRRACNAPAPMYGGRPCPGVSVQSGKCQNKACVSKPSMKNKWQIFGQ